jgi:hypothetical protein
VQVAIPDHDGVGPERPPVELHAPGAGVNVVGVTPTTAAGQPPVEWPCSVTRSGSARNAGPILRATPIAQATSWKEAG